VLYCYRNNFCFTICIFWKQNHDKFVLHNCTPGTQLWSKFSTCNLFLFCLHNFWGTVSNKVYRPKNVDFGSVWRALLPYFSQKIPTLSFWSRNAVKRRDIFPFYSPDGVIHYTTHRVTPLLSTYMIARPSLVLSVFALLRLFVDISQQKHITAAIYSDLFTSKIYRRNRREVKMRSGSH